MAWTLAHGSFLWCCLEVRRRSMEIHLGHRHRLQSQSAQWSASCYTQNGSAVYIVRVRQRKIIWSLSLNTLTIFPHFQASFCQFQFIPDCFLHTNIKYLFIWHEAVAHCIYHFPKQQDSSLLLLILLLWFCFQMVLGLFPRDNMRLVHCSWSSETVFCPWVHHQLQGCNFSLD